MLKFQKLWYSSIAPWKAHWKSEGSLFRAGLSDRFLPARVRDFPEFPPDRPAPKEIALHYYQFNIGDYSSHTRHLTLFEDLAYRRLLDEYYLHERPFSECLTTVARQIGMRDQENEVKYVLETFFVLGERGWENKRAEEEIARFKAKNEASSRGGKKSAERRLNIGSSDLEVDLKSPSSTVQPTNNHKPITNNQEPVKNNTRLPAFSRPPDVEESVWNDFCQHRKAQRATITQTAIDGIQKEAKKAGWNLEAALRECVLRGWRGFKAEWVREKSLNRQEALEARNRAIGDAWLAKETANETR